MIDGDDVLASISHLVLGDNVVLIICGCMLYLQISSVGQSGAGSEPGALGFPSEGSAACGQGDPSPHRTQGT